MSSIIRVYRRHVASQSDFVEVGVAQAAIDSFRDYSITQGETYHYRLVREDLATGLLSQPSATWAVTVPVVVLIAQQPPVITLPGQAIIVIEAGVTTGEISYSVVSPDGSNLTLVWEQLNGPMVTYGANSTLLNSEGEGTLRIENLQVGSFTLRLTATNEAGVNAEAEIVILVELA